MAPYDGPSMHIGNYSFRPRLIPSLITLLLLPVLVSLGFWQLDRAEQKFSARELRAQRLEQSPKPLAAGDTDAGGMLARRVLARGHFDLQHQFLLQNQLYREQPGYQVYTPLRLSEEVGVLVDRGWTAAHFGRQEAPDLSGSAERLALTAVVDTPPSIGLKLGEPDGGAKTWPRRVQYLDLDWAQRQLDYRLLPYVLLPLDLSERHLVQNRKPEQIGERGMPPEKHVSYAVQWFALAFALAVIYIAVNTRRLKGRK